jgi:hypothetical protein
MMPIRHAVHLAFSVGFCRHLGRERVSSRTNGCSLGFKSTSSFVSRLEVVRNQQSTPAVAVIAATGAAVYAAASASFSPSVIPNMSDNIRPWRLYVIPASQFAAKAMLGLDVSGVRYKTVTVSALSRSAREKALPTGGFKVPQVEIPEMGSNGEETFRPLAESSDILHAIDAFRCTDQLYPSDDQRIVDADKHISSVIDAHVMYFNHVSTLGWSLSIRSKITSLLPLGPLWNLVPLHLLYSSMREQVRQSVAAELRLDATTMTDARMTESLICALETYESALDGSSGSGQYLFGYSKATAADCALHAMVSRFVDSMGDANLPAALPDLFDKSGSRLEKLERWQLMMSKTYPMKWTR